MGKVTSMFRCCFTPGKSAPKPSRDTAAAPAEILSGMKPKEAPFAGYLMARSAMHRTIDNAPEIEWEINPSVPRKPGEKAELTGRFDRQTDTLKNLRAGQETVQQVSELMPLGRANVVQDIAKAQDAHLPLRKDATDTLLCDLLKNHILSNGDLTNDEILGATSAATQYAKTGTCGSFASVTTPLHAAKLADMKNERAVVAYTGHKEKDHAWCEMISKGQNKNDELLFHGNDVIIDGWCKNNLAILREDCKFARLDKDGKANQIKHDEPLNHRSGPEVQRVVEKYKAKIENSPHFQDSFKKEFDRLVKEKHEWPAGSFWSATDVLDTNFNNQARAALHKDVNHVQGTKDVQEAAKFTGVAKESLMEKVFRSRAKQARLMEVRHQAEQIKHASLAEIQAIGVARSLGANIRGAKVEAPTIIASARDMFPRPESAPSS